MAATNASSAAGDKPLPKIKLYWFAGPGVAPEERAD